jgi:CheY-like chemotaxis protein
MATNSTLLCIHRDPAQLSLLQQNGYELVTATTGSDGLRLFMSRSVDAIVLEYQLGFLDGGVVAAEIKKVKPKIPIVMLAETGDDLPREALNSVDVLLLKPEKAYLLWVLAQLGALQRASDVGADGLWGSKSLRAAKGLLATGYVQSRNRELA